MWRSTAVLRMGSTASTASKGLKCRQEARATTCHKQTIAPSPSPKLFSTTSSNARSPVQLGAHVRQALANGCPVVALESTVITHGLPEPQNLRLALELEDEIASGRWWSSSSSGEMRDRVVPATVGVVKGQLIVGLTRDQIEFLARRELSEPIKASRSDLALVQACGLSAGTTVSATTALATSCSLAGNRIAVFATGGLGGVHLGGELSMDVSADLYELARSSMGLVSSGFKSFLDTRRSLEFLETMGCTVASLRGFEETYSAAMADADSSTRLEGLEAKRGQLFPGFFTLTNKELARSPWRCDDVQEAARILFHCLDGAGSAEFELRNARSMLLACPIPARFSLDQAQVGQDSQTASQEAYSPRLLASISAEIEARPDLSGNERTPLILAELARRTGGKTLEANLELLKNNARVGAHLAHEHSLLSGRARAVGPPRSPPVSDQAARTELSNKMTNCPRRTGPPIVIGCTMIDMHVRTRIDDKFKRNPHHSGVTFDGEPHLTLGGVGRNLASAIELLGHEPHFITSLASDSLGQFARGELEKLSGSLRHRLEVLEWSDQASPQTIDKPATSCFALVLIDSITGQCEYVIANLEASRAISRQNLVDKCQLGAKLGRDHTPLVVLDANLQAEAVEYVLEVCHNHRVPVFLEPTDVACLPRLVSIICRIRDGTQAAVKLRSLAFMSPNVIELCELVRLFRAVRGRPCEDLKPENDVRLSIEQIEQLARELMGEYVPSLRFLLVTMDKRGLLVGQRGLGTDVGRTRPLLELEGNNNSETVGDNTTFRLYEPLEVIENPISGSGAGDCFASGFISGLLGGRTLDECVEKGFRASMCALRDKSTVPAKLRELSR